MLLDAVKRNPFSAEAHVAFGDTLREQGRRYFAHAEYRTALSLGASHVELKEKIAATSAPLSARLSLDTPLYHRLALVSEAIKGVIPQGGSILDVGGANGMLAHFLPEYDYFLVDPSSNGLSLDLLGDDSRSFDVVSSCHVLEHVPPVARHSFLDDLCRRANCAVILLQPTLIAPRGAERSVELERATKRLELMMEVMNNPPWAQEHLECGLPSLEEIEVYCDKRDYCLDARPYGGGWATVAMLFMSYFAREGGRAADAAKVNRLFNERMDDSLIDSGDMFQTLCVITGLKGRAETNGGASDRATGERPLTG